MIENKRGEVRFKVAESAGAHLSPAQEVEARWEFSLAASNLPKAIPADVRKFLRLVSRGGRRGTSRPRLQLAKTVGGALRPDGMMFASAESVHKAPPTVRETGVL